MDQVDTTDFIHKSLAAGRWDEMSLAEQMVNIGSEVSRALKARQRKKPEMMQSAFYRALELIDLSIRASVRQYHAGEITSGRIRELCRAREELCDYFAGNNDFCTDPQKLQRYYDQFITLARSRATT